MLSSSGMAGGDPSWPDVAAVRGGASRVVLSPPANHVFSKMVPVPKVARRRLRAVVEFEAAQAVPRPLAELSWGWAVSKDRGAVDLGAMTAALAERWCVAAEEAGARLEAIVPRASALRLVVQYNYPELANGSFVVVEAGRESALVVRVERGVGVARLVGLAIPVAVAAGGVDQEGNVSVARIRRLGAELARAVAPADGEPAPVEQPVVFVAAGEEGDLTGMREWAAGAGVRLEALDALRRVKVGARAVGAGALAPGLAVAVGTALAAVFGGGPDLLPEPRRRVAAFRRRRWWYLGTAGAFALAVWGAACWFGVRARAGELKVSRLEVGAAGWRATRAEVESLQREIAAGERELAVIGALERARGGWAEWMARLEEDLRAAGGVWIERVEPLADRRSVPDETLFGHRENAGDAPGVAEWRLRVTGAVRADRADGVAALDRVRDLLERWRSRPGVLRVGQERFDAGAGELLRFSCVLEMDAEVAP